jgi:sugar phosphate isomerase/epimerase
MKLGFISAILPELSFEELVDYAVECGYSMIEVCCWPEGKAERRYSGITHINVDTLTDDKISEIQSYIKKRGIGISALGYYPNPLDPDEEKSNFYVTHLKKLIVAAAKLNVNKVTTFIGKDKSKSVDENFVRFKQVWTPIIKFAEEHKVQVCIENCPMYFTKDEWPGGNNLATSPAIWRRMFSEIKSDYFGLNFDPSHFLWMQMDYIKAIYEFKDKLFHIQLKDAKVYRDKLNEVGILAHPLEYHSPKLPGLGDVDWGKFISALTDIRYKGAVCVEVEDKAFEDSLEDKKYSLLLCKKYLNQFI